MTSRVSFSIDYTGSSQCWEKATLCAIEFTGLQSDVLAISNKTSDSTLYAGPLKWRVRKPNSSPFLFGSQTIIDKMCITPAVAQAFTLTALVFEDYKGTSVIKHPIPIHIPERPQFQTSQSYLIRVTKIGARNFSATFIQQESKPVQPKTPEEPVSCQPRKIDPSTLSPALRKKLEEANKVGDALRRSATEEKAKPSSSDEDS